VHRILERYLARTPGLAEQAISNFENSPRTKFANQLQTDAVAHAQPKQKIDASQSVSWRATVDEDGHYSFAVPL
jgi:hypothetical protein